MVIKVIDVRGMKQSVILLAIVMGSFGAARAQNRQGYTVMDNGGDGVTIVFSAGSIEAAEVKTDKGSFSHITVAGDGYSYSTEVGKPKLPVLVKLIEIPICADLQLAVKPLSDYKEFDAAELGIHHPIIPAQPSRSKSYEGEVSLIKDDTAYNTNRFYGLPLGRVERVGIKRNVNMAALYFSPVSYNPVTRKVRIYQTVQFEVSYHQADIPATREMKLLHSNGLFPAAQSQVINPDRRLQKDMLATAPVKYLIVAHAMFRGQLDSFAAWKRRKGFLVEVAYTDEAAVGSANTSIKSFIKGHYDNATPENPAPTFVLLVGDVAEIPPFAHTGHYSDLDYMCWTEGDYLPDCYYGRFSAQNIAQLTPQIEKTLMYEQYTMPSTAYLNDAVLIAGTAGGGLNDNQKKINGQMNYLSSLYINEAQGYNHVYYHRYNSSGEATAIRSEIGQGVGFVNYTAHCSPTGWTNPQFNTAQIPNMQNRNRYGLMIGNCCQSSKFDLGECFAEMLLRVPDKGAVGYIGASDNTYWDEDYAWSVGTYSIFSEYPTYNASHLGAYDRLFHTHNEPYSDWYITNGAIITAGNMAVEASTSLIKDFYWEVYHLMGDPSLMTCLSEPERMTVSVSPTLIAGETSLEIHAAPHAYVALTGNNATTLHAAGFTDAAGNITLTFEPLPSGSYEIAASAQNHIISFRPITVIPLTGAYITASPMSSTNGTDTKYNSTVELVALLSNTGIANANAVSVKVTSLSPLLTLLNDTLLVGTIAAADQYSTTPPFQVQIAPYPYDGQLAPIEMKVYFDGLTTSQVTNLVLKAPDFTVELASVQDEDNNGIIDPGETVTLTVNNRNTGHADADKVYAAMVSHYCQATVANTLLTDLVILEDSVTQTQYIVKIDSSVPSGTVIPLYYKIRKYPHEVTDTFMIKVGNTTDTVMASEDCITDFPPMSIENVTPMAEHKISLYPNPATSMLTIEAEETTLRKWELLDSYGRLLQQSGRLQHNRVEIGVSELSAGLYFVRITDQNSHITVKKLIKR